MARLAALLLALLISGCASMEGATNPRDPWEPMNRKTHAFNTALDEAVLKPIVTGYTNYFPGWFQEGVNNFYGNVEDVGNSMNSFLQGKPKDGISDIMRVLMNSTLGFFGLWDVATPFGLEKHEEDFGQTLGKWGVPPGPYFVIPLLGPSSARDAPARFVDPQWYFATLMDASTYWELWTVDKLRVRANLIQAETVLQAGAIDKYSFIRDAWLQRRQNLIYDGNPPRPKEDQ